MELNYFFQFAIAIFLGALIGLQREYTQQHTHFKKFAGFRTFILVTFLGAILGYFGQNFNSLLVIVGLIGVILFSAISYYSGLKNYYLKGTTTEIALILSYLLGVMCTLNFVSLAVMFGIIIVGLLTFKEGLHGIAKKIEKKEMFAIVKFALISLVILPILPNKNYALSDFYYLSKILTSFGVSLKTLSQIDVFNFYYIWLMVIFISGIGFLGYFLVKFIDSKKGYGLLGFMGGLVSSTAVTLSMAEKSKRHSKIFYPLVVATILATTVMFLRILFEVAILNSELIPVIILPLGVMGLCGFLSSFFFLRRTKKEDSRHEIEFEQPFSLVPALKFGLLFLLFLFLSKIALLFFGSTGIYVTSILSGLADVNAITLSMANLSHSGGVTNSVATTAIMLAAISNTLVKAGMAYYLGNKKFGKTILLVFSIILIIGLLTLFFI